MCHSIFVGLAFFIIFDFIWWFLMLISLYGPAHTILVLIPIAVHGRLNFLLPWKFFMNICRLLIVFEINFFEKFFQKYHLCVKQFGSRSGPTLIWVRSCLYKFSVDDTKSQRVKQAFASHMHNYEGAQWLSGRVLDSRLKGRGFQPHRRHFVVSLSKTH